MKKKIYTKWLAALVMAGAVLTSCVDYNEPNGTDEMRKAKAKVYEADATWRLADAKLREADAQFRQYEAEQQKFIAEAEGYRAQIVKLDIELKKLEVERAQATTAEHKAKCDAAIAEANRQKALAETQMTELQKQHEANMIKIQTEIVNNQKAYEMAIKDLVLMRDLISQEYQAQLDNHVAEITRKNKAVVAAQTKVIEAGLNLQFYIANIDSVSIANRLKIDVAQAELNLHYGNDLLDILKKIEAAQGTDFHTEIAELRLEIAAQDAKIQALNVKISQETTNGQLALVTYSDAVKALLAEKNTVKLTIPALYQHDFIVANKLESFKDVVRTVSTSPEDPTAPIITYQFNTYPNAYDFTNEAEGQVLVNGVMTNISQVAASFVIPYTVVGTANSFKSAKEVNVGWLNAMLSGTNPINNAANNMHVERDNAFTAAMTAAKNGSEEIFAVGTPSSWNNYDGDVAAQGGKAYAAYLLADGGFYTRNLAAKDADVVAKKAAWDAAIAAFDAQNNAFKAARKAWADVVASLDVFTPSADLPKRVAGDNLHSYLTTNVTYATIGASVTGGIVTVFQAEEYARLLKLYINARKAIDGYQGQVRAVVLMAGNNPTNFASKVVTLTAENVSTYLNYTAAATQENVAFIGVQNPQTAGFPVAAEVAYTGNAAVLQAILNVNNLSVSNPAFGLAYVAGTPMQVGLYTADYKTVDVVANPYLQVPGVVLPLAVVSATTATTDVNVIYQRACYQAFKGMAGFDWATQAITYFTPDYNRAAGLIENLTTPNAPVYDLVQTLTAAAATGSAAQVLYATRVSAQAAYNVAVAAQTAAKVALETWNDNKAKLSAMVAICTLINVQVDANMNQYFEFDASVKALKEVVAAAQLPLQLLQVELTAVQTHKAALVSLLATYTGLDYRQAVITQEYVVNGLEQQLFAANQAIELWNAGAGKDLNGFIKLQIQKLEEVLANAKSEYDEAVSQLNNAITAKDEFLKILQATDSAFKTTK